MHDTYKFIRKMDDISSCQLLVLRHEGDTIHQNEVMFIRRFVGLDAVIPNDLVEALHRHIEDKSAYSRILELITSGNVILSSPSFNEKTTAGFEGGRVMVSTPKYTVL